MNEIDMLVCAQDFCKKMSDFIEADAALKASRSELAELTREIERRIESEKKEDQRKKQEAEQRLKSATGRISGILRENIEQLQSKTYFATSEETAAFGELAAELEELLKEIRLKVAALKESEKTLTGVYEIMRKKYRTYDIDLLQSWISSETRTSLINKESAKN